MTLDPALVLSQWFSAGGRVRAFSFANGLPWMVQSGEISTTDDLLQWLETLLSDGSGYHDAMYLSSAYETKNSAQIAALNELYLSYCGSADRLAETREQALVFARLMRRNHDLDVSELAYPIAIGSAAQNLGIPLEMTLRFYLETFVGRFVDAAADQLNCGEESKKRILHALRDQIETLARTSMNLAAKGQMSISTGCVEPTHRFYASTRRA